MNRMTIVVCALFGLAACTKDPRASCTYKHANPAFCFSPPEGYTAEPETKFNDGQMSMMFTAGKNSFSLNWNHSGTFEEHVESAKVHVGAIKLVAEGNLDNGGYWCHSTMPQPSGPTHLVTYFVRGKSSYVELNAGVKDEQAANAIILAGKTITVD